MGRGGGGWLRNTALFHKIFKFPLSLQKKKKAETDSAADSPGARVGGRFVEFLPVTEFK